MKEIVTLSFIRMYRTITQTLLVRGLILIAILSYSLPSRADLGESLTSSTTQQNTSYIKGVVKDDGGVPIAGATVIIVGTSVGAVTDANGLYSIEYKPSYKTIQFSFIGMISVEKSISSASTIDAVLMIDMINVEEIVAVGYGVQKRSNLTGAVSTADMDQVVGDRLVDNPAKALAGVIPGLQVLENTSQPGYTQSSITIRGYESINGGSPLVLVDNVPMSMDQINPKDVDKVIVLKDAASTAIYGARAAFGVILISTKGGKRDQKLKFNYSATFGFTNPTELPEKASPIEFVTALDTWGTTSYWLGQDIPTWRGLLEEYNADPSTYSDGTAVVDGTLYLLSENDLLGEFIDNSGFEQIHNFNFSGGSANSSYRVSFGHTDQDGVMVTDQDSYKKYNVNSTLNTDLSSMINFTSTIFFRNSTRISPVASYTDALSQRSFAKVGYHTFEDGSTLPYDTPKNLVSYRTPTIQEKNDIRLFGRVVIEPIEALKVSGEFTYSRSGNEVVSANNNPRTVDNQRLTENPLDPEASYFKNSNSITKYRGINTYINYDKSLDSHNISAVLGFNYEDNYSQTVWVKKTNLMSGEIPSLSTATGTLTSDDSYSEWAVSGVFGRISYNYAEKYLLELNGRYDGSSRFPDGDRYDFFPSISVGWNMKREDFMSSVDFVNKLKLRASLGEIGNQQTSGVYPAIPGMVAVDAGWIDSDTSLKYRTLNPPALVSSSFTWETVRTLDIGTDITVLDGRLSTSFDWYRRETLDMLAPGAELPDVLGASAPEQNVADLETLGWEVEAAWKDNIGSVRYNVGFNISDSRTEVTEYDNAAGIIGEYRVGYEIGEIWGFVTDGYYTEDDFVEGTLGDDLTGGELKDDVVSYKGKNENPGDVKYKNLDPENGTEIFTGNGTVYDPGDRMIIGNSSRRYNYGFNGSVAYKGFDLSFMFQGVGKRQVYINSDLFWPYRDQFDNVLKHQLDYWTPENLNAFYPRNYQEGGDNYGNSRKTQTKYLSDLSYLRFKNITLGYKVSLSKLEQLGVDQFRVFCSVENPYTWDKLPKGMDPEMSGYGANYPLMRKVTCGLNLSF